MRSKRVLLLGSYGQTNLGDDLLMWNYLDFLKRRDVTEVLVNANHEDFVPTAIKADFPTITILPTYMTSMFDWLRIARSVDIVMYGGGTVYKELYGSTGRGKYSVIARIAAFNMAARLLGVRIVHMHIGIGVLKTWLGRFITRTALRCSYMTIFRDNESFNIAKNKLKLPPSSLCVTADGLFLQVGRWQKPWHTAAIKVSAPHKTVIGINVLSDIPDWVDRKKYLHTLRTFIASIASQKNVQVVLLPFQHDFNPHNDLAFMRSEILPHVPKHIHVVDKVPIDQVASYFSQLDVFIGMRFHSLLLATITGTPFLALSYDTKCSRFLEESNYPYTVKLEDASVDALQTTYNQVLRDLPKIPAMLRHITHANSKKGQQCLERLVI